MLSFDAFFIDGCFKAHGGEVYRRGEGVIRYRRLCSFLKGLYPL